MIIYTTSLNLLDSNFDSPNYFVNKTYFLIRIISAMLYTMTSAYQEKNP